MSYYSYRYWGNYRESKRDRLTRLFAGIDRDIQKIFFTLSSYELDSIFISYGEIYGANAERYARKTYNKWKTGQVTLSGQTAERLLELLPPRLSKSQRYDLIKKLRQHYVKKSNAFITTAPENWRNEVINAVQKVILAGRDCKLPQELYEKATWLTNGDVQAVHKILASIDEEEAKIRTSYLEGEFKRIELFVVNIKNTESASHTISLPQGNIYVTIKKEKTSFFQSVFKGNRMMNEKPDKRDELERALVQQQSRGNLLNLNLDDLSNQQKIELREKIIHERIQIDVSQSNADQRFYNSTRDMAQTIKAINALEQSSKSDYEVNSNFETASGRTDIHVKKNNNTVIIVVAIVIGIIILMVMK